MQHYANSNRNRNNMEDVPVTSSEEWLPAADQVSRNVIKKLNMDAAGRPPLLLPMGFLPLQRHE